MPHKRKFLMKPVNTLRVMEECLTCNLREDYLFCNMPQPALEMMDEIKTSANYPKGAILFTEGQDVAGVHILCHGKVKVSTSSAEGKIYILRIAEGGDVLGLSAAVSNLPYDATAEVLEPTQINFISRANFLRFITRHGEVALRVAQQLSVNYKNACREIRSLSLSQNAAEKLSRLILDWTAHKAEHSGKQKDSSNSVNIQMTLTHEEISQLIGVSRETVTRMMGDLKRKKLIEVHGATLIVRDKKALAKMVDGGF